MQKVNVTELRQHLPAYLRKVRAGKSLEITVRGKVVARLVAEEDPAEAAKRALKALRKTAVIGDIMSPIDVE